jgi:hypothetical protein
MVSSGKSVHTPRYRSRSDAGLRASHSLDGRPGGDSLSYLWLAGLATYRDWRVFIPATLVVAADHLFRGIYWPQSVFGVLTANYSRWIEHAGWVVFENIILVRLCLQSVQEMKDIALQRSELEATNLLVEGKVLERTADLETSRKGFALGEGSRRSRQRGEKYVSGDDESRDSYAHERNPRHDGVGPCQ